MHAKASNNLGNALRIKGNLVEAVAAYREAVRLVPMATVYHCNLGLALAARKDYDGSIAAYREAIRLEPMDASHRCNLGIVLARSGDLDGAIEQFHFSLMFKLQYQTFRKVLDFLPKPMTSPPTNAK